MRVMGCKLVLIGGVLASTATLAWVPAAGARSSVKTCGIFHSSALSPHEPWRGYQTGSVTCGAATAVLIAVLAGRGDVHLGSDSENSYIVYHGFKCDLEAMGSQLCWRPAGSFSRATAVIAAIDCSNTGGCPARYPDPL